MSFNQNYILVVIIFVIYNMIHLVYCAALPDEGNNRWSGKPKRTKFWCNKYKQCLSYKVRHGTTPVCGWDEELGFLAVFDNECVLFQANCNSAGRFFIVKMEACETKKKYDEQHPNQEFEWYSVLPCTTTTPRPKLNYTTESANDKKWSQEEEEYK